ncbi:MAG: OmpA family protein [Hyphomicrobiaceae bacterium]
MSASRSEQAEVVRLKELLFHEERHSLSAIREIVEQHHDRIGTDARLSETVSTVLAESFKAADIKNHRELAGAVSPLVVTSIKREIVNSRDEMVEALYPIMGRLVSAYVSAAVRDAMESTNERLESGLSLRFLRLRVKSLFTRRPYRELRMLESGSPRVRELLLIKRSSGVLVDRWLSPGEPEAASGQSGALIGGLLSAINDFARQAFAGGRDELRALDIGGSRLFLRTSAAHLLAVRATGATGRRVQRAIDGALIDILEKHTNALIDTEEPGAKSEIRTILPELADSLGEVLESEKRKPVLAFALLSLLGLAIAGGIGWYAFDHYRTEALRSRVATAIEADPAFSGYPIDIVVARGRASVRLKGLAPSSADAERLGKVITQDIAPIPVEPRFAYVTNERALHDALTELDGLTKRLQALDASLGRFAGQGDLLALSALIPEIRTELDKLRDEAATKPEMQANLSEISTALDGMKARLATLAGKVDVERLAADLDALSRRLDDPMAALQRLIGTQAVFFDVGTAVLNKTDAEAMAKAVASQVIAAGVDLRVVGFTDPRGTSERNRDLAGERARIVADLLVKAGLPRERLILVARPDGPLISDIASTDGQSDRRVALEIAYRGERSFGGARRP